jgi:hypothetical protein
MEPILILAACTVGLIMTAMHIQHRRRVKARRAAMFDQCKQLFSDVSVSQDDVNFPVLTGCYRGLPVKLEPVADHVGYRKLPSLWLLVTVRGEIPYEGVFDFLVRPQNIEFFSPSDRLEFQLEQPAHWPQYAVLKTNNVEKMPPVAMLEKHIDLFQDDKAKELLVTPGGVRIVYQANQANQNSYRTLRSLAFDDLVLKPERVTDLLDRALLIYQDLTEKAEHEITEHHFDQTLLKTAC